MIDESKVSKLIVINRTTLHDADVMRRVATFMSTDRESYLSHVTTFNDGVMVSAKRNLRSVTVYVWEKAN